MGRPKNNKVIHPDSRKARWMQKNIKRKAKKNAKKIKPDPVFERARWFATQVQHIDREEYTYDEIYALTVMFFQRNDDMLENISKKGSVKARALQLLKDKEIEAFGIGVDVPDLTKKGNVEFLLGWDMNIGGMAAIRMRKVRRTDSYSEDQLHSIINTLVGDKDEEE
ncbi:hypothetical protein PCE1_004663 [Barthelona sp. PCE]